MTEATQHKPEEFACVINLEAKIVPAQTVTFEEVVRIAFPHKATEANVTFKVTYRKAEAPHHEGALVTGDSITIKKDGKTSFTVVHATKS
jgi:Multiubiquitin